MSVNQPVAVIGRYALHDEIAAGGMATVHLGRLLGPVGFARTVAIKRLHQQYARDPEFVSMFLDEARLAARIRHPHVVPTLDVVALSGELFLVMEYVHGVSLSKLLRSVIAQHARIPVEIVASIIVGALHGLHAAHEAHSERGLPLGIVHRDVSPQNIMVGSDGMSRVLDFGVAKAAWRIQTTRDGQVKGKLAYMAPEQVNGGQVGPWTDVYSTAVVLWEALANQRLFNRSDSAVLARFIDGCPVAPPSQHNDQVNAALDAIVVRALDTEPSKRFATAREMADAIEGCVRIASSSSVGRWLQGAVREQLDEHSALIAEIENGSTASGRPPGDDAPSFGRILASLSAPKASEVVTQSFNAQLERGEEQSARSQISMTRSPSLSDGLDSRRKRLLQVGAVASAVAALSVLFLVLTRAPAQPESPAGGAPVALAAAPRTALPPAEAIASSPLAALPANSVAPAPTAPQPSATPLAAPVPRRAPREPDATRRTSSCSPPYTVDSRGIRHMKLYCVR